MGIFKREALAKAQEKKKQTKRHTILIVDDEEHNLMTLSDLLQDEYEILEAKDGLEALALIKAQENPERIQMIISDQRMPEMTGVELFRASLDIIPRTKRILLTGYTDVDAIIASINKGQIYKFVLKPFGAHDMLMTIRRALEACDLEVENEKLVQKLTQLNAELEDKVTQRTAELQQANTELKQINASKDRFFSIVAHDLRNPFHTFLLTTETLMESIDELSLEEVIRFSGNMHKSAHTLSRLLENLLEWSRLQMNTMQFHPAHHNLQKFVDDTFYLLEDTAKRKGVELQATIDKNCSVFVDKKMIETVFRNLVSNAIKFTYEGGWIRISCEVKDDEMVIAFADNGVGMSGEQIDKLFRIDVQTTTRGTSKEKGTGLGLILCHELIKNNHGRLWAESDVGEGSTFFVALPRKLPVSGGEEQS